MLFELYFHVRGRCLPKEGDSVRQVPSIVVVTKLGVVAECDFYEPLYRCSWQFRP